MQILLPLMLPAHAIMTATSIANSTAQRRPIDHPTGDATVLECPRFCLPWIPQGYLLTTKSPALPTPRSYEASAATRTLRSMTVSSLHSRLGCRASKFQIEVNKAARDWVTSAPASFCLCSTAFMPARPIRLNMPFPRKSITPYNLAAASLQKQACRATLMMS